MTLAPAAADIVYHRGNGGEPNSLDPHRSSATWESHIIRDLFLGLVVHDGAGNVIPGAAESWEMSADGRRYLFHIRPDLRWSDGTPVTADDFVFSFRRLVDPATGAEYASNLHVLENGRAVNVGEMPLESLGVAALDARRLELRLHTPVPYLLQLLTHVSTYAVPRHVVEREGRNWVRPGVMVSNGAYVLAEWRPQTFVRLDRNPLFYDNDAVQIDRVYFHPIEDDNTALKRFRAGEIDSHDRFPARQYGWLKANMPDKVHVAPWLGVYYYAFNSAKPPFDDRRVRRALAMTIPREAITEKLLGYGVIPAWSFVPPGVDHYERGSPPDFAAWPAEKRLATARALLAEAGWGPDNPLEVTLSYNTDREHKKVALAVAHAWKKLGVVTRLFNVEAKVHFNNLKTADFEIARAGWIADYNDAENFLFLMASSTGRLNYGQFHNPEYDALMAEASRSLDLDRRAEILRKAEAIAMAEQPVTPIYFYVSRNLVQPWVKGWTTNIVDVHPTRFLRVERRR